MNAENALWTEKYRPSDFSEIKGQKEIVKRVKAFVEQKNLPTVTVNLAKPFPAKGMLVGKNTIDAVALAFQKFADFFGMKVPSAEWKKTERELHLKTEKGFVVWLDLTKDVEAQLQKLKRALPKLDIYHEPLEYIDLRIAGSGSEKVIFRRKR